jgi:hypothetical protein
MEEAIMIIKAIDTYLKARPRDERPFVKGDRKVRRWAGEKCGTWVRDNPSYRMSQTLLG